MEPITFQEKYLRAARALTAAYLIAVCGALPLVFWNMYFNITETKLAFFLGASLLYLFLLLLVQLERKVLLLLLAVLLWLRLLVQLGQILYLMVALVGRQDVLQNQLAVALDRLLVADIVRVRHELAQVVVENRVLPAEDVHLGHHQVHQLLLGKR